MTLENKTAIVTGGSRGIGRAICVALAEAGANVVTCYAHGAAGAEETVKLCEAYGVKASAIRADVAKNEDVQALVTKVKEEYGSIDILVNNAGIGDKQMAITRCSDEWWRQIIAVNQDSVFYMSRAALVYMEKQGEGSIVNISSIGGVFANAGIAYSAAKAAVVAMTKNVAIQFAGKGIRCNAVCPGPTITPLLSSDEIATFDQEFMKTCNEHICRSVPKAEAVDQANAILYFASDLSKAVTGQALVVDYGCNL